MTHAHHKRLRTRAALVAVLCASAGISGCGGGGTAVEAPPPASAAPSEQEVATKMTAMRQRWSDFLTGGDAINSADADVAARINAIAATASAQWTAMDKTAGRTALWTDLNTWTNPANLTANYTRLRQLALAYQTKGSSLQGNAALAADIVGALNWLYTNKYNETVAQFGNWWEWEIGIPKALGDVLTLMYGQLSPTLLGNYIRALDKFNPSPVYKTWSGTALPAGAKYTTEMATGVNLLDKSLGVALRGMLGGQPDMITAARDAMVSSLKTVTSGDGFYEDGSYVQNGYVGYIGGNGAEMVDDIAQIAYLINKTTWDIQGGGLGIVYEWVGQHIVPFIYRGAMADSVRGRAISRSATTDHVAGRSMIVALSRLAEVAPSNEAAEIKGYVKSWVAADTTFAAGAYYTGQSLFDISRIKGTVADAAITATPVIRTQMFGGMARAVHVTDAWAFNLTMFSDRISAFESGNGENLKGWLTGAGMTSVHTPLLTHYSGNYWATIDYNRLPGVTTDGASYGTPVDGAFYGNRRGMNWTGGSSVPGAYASAGMEFAMTSFLLREKEQVNPITGQPFKERASPSSLSGKKSWFMFGDKVIAMGSDITGNDGRAVETIVENRKLNTAGSNVLTVNGAAALPTVGSSATLPAVNWAHLAESSGNGIGFYFPTPVGVQAKRELRTGTWRDVNSTGTTAAQTDRYLSLAIGHGVNPARASYAYVLIPNRNAAAVSALAAAPDVKVLHNTPTVHAAMYTPATTPIQPVSSVVGANFWADGGGAVTIDGSAFMNSDAKASVTVASTASTLAVGLADPTEANTGKVTLTIARSAVSVLKLDPAITVKQLSPTIVLEVDVKNARGKTLQALLVQ